MTLHRVALALAILSIPMSPVAMAADVLLLTEQHVVVQRVLVIAGTTPDDAARWASTIPAKDLKAAAEACRKIESKSLRVSAACNRVEHRHAINSL